jgi:hypothetical protein
MLVQRASVRKQCTMVVLSLHARMQSTYVQDSYAALVALLRGGHPRTCIEHSTLA